MKYCPFCKRILLIISAFYISTHMPKTLMILFNVILFNYFEVWRIIVILCASQYWVFSIYFTRYNNYDPKTDNEGF